MLMMSEREERWSAREHAWVAVAWAGNKCSFPSSPQDIPLSFHWMPIREFTRRHSRKSNVYILY